MDFCINIPHFKCLVRAEYLFNLESHFNEFIPCRVFGATSINGRSVGFNLMTDQGAQIARVPVHALAANEKAIAMPLDWLQLWDCFSYQMTAIEYDYLSLMRCKVFMKDKKWYAGTYVFTFDWCGGDYAEDPSEHKCGHLIALDNGCYAIQPNNRIYWEEPGFITKPFTVDERPGYKVNTHVWKSETQGKWMTEDSDRFFYDTKSSVAEPLTAGDLYDKIVPCPPSQVVKQYETDPDTLVIQIIDDLKSDLWIDQQSEGYNHDDLEAF